MNRLETITYNGPLSEPRKVLKQIHESIVAAITDCETEKRNLTTCFCQTCYTPPEQFHEALKKYMTTLTLNIPPNHPEYQKVLAVWTNGLPQFKEAMQKIRHDAKTKRVNENTKDTEE